MDIGASDSTVMLVSNITDVTRGEEGDATTLKSPSPDHPGLGSTTSNLFQHQQSKTIIEPSTTIHQSSSSSSRGRGLEGSSSHIINKHSSSSAELEERASSVSPPASSIPPNWTLDDFEFIRQIGEGRFGTVYLAREKASGYKVAVKAVRKDDVIRLDMRHQLEREVRLQKYASRHPHVLALYAYFWDKKFVYIVMEYCDGGDLSSYTSMRSPRRHLVEESLVASWTRQLLDAVAFLHDHRMVHRDIKPENIMIKKGRIKLGDFTWCVSLQLEPPFDRRRTICGTLDYLSPELVSHLPYDTQLDVWSIGVVAYELLVGVPPFEHPRPVDTCLCIQRGEFTIPPDTMSPLAEDFLRSVLIVEPSERPSCRDLLKHPWIETAPPPSSSSSRRRGGGGGGGGSRRSSRSRSQQQQQHNSHTNSSNALGTTFESSSSQYHHHHHSQQQQHQQQQQPVRRGESMTSYSYNNNNNNNTVTTTGGGGVEDDDDVSRALELSGIEMVSPSHVVIGSGGSGESTTLSDLQQSSASHGSRSTVAPHNNSELNSREES